MQDSGISRMGVPRRRSCGRQKPEQGTKRVRAGISGNDPGRLVGCECDPGRKDGFERLFACFAETMGEDNMVGGAATNPIQSDLINAGGGETRLDGELGILGLYIYTAGLVPVAQMHCSRRV